MNTNVGMNVVCPQCSSSDVTLLTPNNYKCSKCNTWFAVVEGKSSRKISRKAGEVDWDFVKEKIDSNRRVSTDWKKVFGDSVNGIVASFRAAGADNASFIYHELCKTHPSLTLEQIKDLKVSVAARFAEQCKAEMGKRKAK